MRRILIIVLVIILIGAGVWFFYVKPREQAGMPVPNTLKAFFPTTTTTNNSGSFGTDTNIPNSTAASNAANKPIFQQLTARPVAGYSVFSITNTPPVVTKTITKTVKGKKTTVTIVVPPAASATPQVTTIDHIVDYIGRNNGYVYQIKDGAIPLQITNIFIPNVYEGFFADNNNTAILRFLQSNNQTITTYSVPIPPLNTDGTRTQLAGTYLPDNISALAISNDQTQVTRVTNDRTGATVSLSNSVGKNIKTVVHSPFQEWLPSWANNTLYLQTKAASIADGFLYSVNQKTAQLQRVIGDVAGLTTSVSPKGTYILYSESTPTGFVTKLFNTKTNSTNNISLAILPEKCAWLQNEDLICAGNNSVPSGTYPDAWYQGTMHFSDQLYRISASTNTYTVLNDGQDQSFDMTNLQVDEGQQLVYFIDKNTGLLWQFSY